MATPVFPTVLRVSTRSPSYWLFSMWFVATSVNNDNDKKPSQHSEPPDYAVAQYSVDHEVSHCLRAYFKSRGHQNIYTSTVSVCQTTTSHVALCHFLMRYNCRPYLHSSPTLAEKAYLLLPSKTTSQGHHFKLHYK